MLSAVQKLFVTKQRREGLEKFEFLHVMLMSIHNVMSLLVRPSLIFGTFEDKTSEDPKSELVQYLVGGKLFVLS